MPYYTFIIYPTKTVAPVTSLWRHVFRRVFSCLDSRVVHEPPLPPANVATQSLLTYKFSEIGDHLTSGQRICDITGNNLCSGVATFLLLVRPVLATRALLTLALT